MNYTKHYPLRSVFADTTGDQAVEKSDRRDGRAYEPTEELELAVNLALAAGRPLLLRGHPGSGKSSFASYFARLHKWRYYELVVTARSQGRDLLYEVDVVRRLADASAEGIKPFHAYVEPGALWWALNRDTARKRGGDNETYAATEQRLDYNAPIKTNHAVVLIDEIDKADPDFPNSLLVPLGSSEFEVKELGITVSSPARPVAKDGKEALSQLLVIVTTNEERELPRGFLRRCIVHELPDVDETRLLQIAKVHFGRQGEGLTGQRLELAKKLAARVMAMAEAARKAKQREPSAGEYLDALRACYALGGEPLMDEQKLWALIESATLIKPDRLRSARA
jgi:MoxR-like ATPase